MTGPEKNRRERGIEPIGTHIDTINIVRAKISPVLTLMKFGLELNMEAALTNEELGNLGWLLKDMLDEVFTAVDKIEEIYMRRSYPIVSPQGQQ